MLRFSVPFFPRSLGGVQTTEPPPPVSLSREPLLRLLTAVSLCWQGPAAARRDAAGTQQEESGQQSGNRSTTDEPNAAY